MPEEALRWIVVAGWACGKAEQAPEGLSKWLWEGGRCNRLPKGMGMGGRKGDPAIPMTGRHGKPGGLVLNHY